MKALERTHRLERDAAQLFDQPRVFVGVVERAVGAQLRLDLVVARQRLCIERAELARGFTLGKREIVDAVLGHDARGSGGDARSHGSLAIAFAGHGCRPIIGHPLESAAPRYAQAPAHPWYL